MGNFAKLQVGIKYQTGLTIKLHIFSYLLSVRKKTILVALSHEVISCRAHLVLVADRVHGADIANLFCFSRFGALPGRLTRCELLAGQRIFSA